MLEKRAQYMCKYECVNILYTKEEAMVDAFFFQTL